MKLALTQQIPHLNFFIMSISAIITAAGKNSRMRKDQISKGLKPQNKLTLPFKDSTIIETTISNALSCNIDECIIVLGHYSSEIKDAISDNFKDKVIHGLENISSNYALCVTGDQPTVSTETFNKLIECAKNSKNPEKTISILRRRKTGLLDTAEGLGMPFVANKNQLINYLKNENDNLNPILRKMFKDGFTFYGIKEKNELELLNINHYDDYKKVLDSF